jgi:hypothetical protein
VIRKRFGVYKLQWPLVVILSSHIVFCFYEIFAKNLLKIINLLSIGLAASYACCIILTMMLIKRRLHTNSFLLLLFPFLVLASGHGEALPALAIFSAGSLAVGAAMVRVFGLASSATSPTERITIAFFSGVCLNGILVWLLMHFTVKDPWVYNLYPVGEVLIFYRYLSSDYWKHLISPDEIRWSNGQFFIFLHACLMLLYQLVPAYSWDDVIGHLYIPKVVFLFGSFDFSPKYIPGLNAAMLPMGVYTSLFLTGGETAVRLMNFIAFYAGALMLEDFSRKNLSDRAGLWSAVATLTTPYVTWVLGLVFTDAFFFFGSAVICIYTLSAVKSGGSDTGAVGLGLLSAFGFLCKLQTITVILPCAILMGVSLSHRLFGKKEWMIAAKVLLGSLLFLGVISIPLIHNYLLSQNPLFPYYNKIFKSPYFAAENFIDGRWVHPLSWRTLYEITFQGNRYCENIDLSYGFWHFCMAFMFVPMLFIVGSRKDHRWFLGAFLIFGASILLLFGVTGPYMRYGLGTLVSGSIVIGYTIDWLLSVCESNRFALSGMRTLMAILLLLNLACQFSIVHVATPYPVREAFRGDFSRSSVVGYQELRRVFDYAAAKFGRNARGLLVDNAGLYLAGTRIESNEWYFTENHKVLRNISDAQKLVSYLFHERKFDYVIMPERGSSMPVFDSPEFRSFLDREFTYYGYGLYVLSGGN